MCIRDSYNTPFPEMEGNIVFVDYELSSWKYQGKEYKLSPYVKYISGELPLPENTGIVLKQGYVVSEEKGDVYKRQPIQSRS